MIGQSAIQGNQAIAEGKDLPSVSWPRIRAAILRASRMADIATMLRDNDAVEIVREPVQADAQLRPNAPSCRGFRQREATPGVCPATEGKGSRMRDLKGATVVITGASSGIGRAAALAFARAGANVVLAARDRRGLQDAAKEVRAQGVRGVPVVTDVTDARQVQRLADQAARAFQGRIDVWVNNAGVGAVGRFTETPVEAHDQVIHTNLLGYIHGAHAALPYFQRQASGGVLINTISFGGWVPAPYAAAYAASKFGLRGFTDSLRSELSDWPEIHVCDVFPSFIDTPGVQHGANFTGREIKPAPPVYAAEKVADEMVSLARNPRDAATVGSVATLARFGYGLAPTVGRWAMNKFIETYLHRAKDSTSTTGNLFRPIALAAVSGGWRSAGLRTVATRLGTGGLAAAGALVALQVGLALVRAASESSSGTPKRLDYTR